MKTLEEIKSGLYGCFVDDDVQESGTDEMLAQMLSICDGVFSYTGLALEGAALFGDEDDQTVELVLDSKGNERRLHIEVKGDLCVRSTRVTTSRAYETAVTLLENIDWLVHGDNA